MKLSSLLERAKAAYRLWGDLDVLIDDEDEYLTVLGDFVCEVSEDFGKRMLLTTYQTRAMLTVVK